jgi:hypothetical protein
MDTNVVSYAAAVAILLGTKLHDSKRELTMVIIYMYIHIYIYINIYIYIYIYIYV